MVKVFNEKMNKSAVVASPEDVTLDGIIVNIEQGMLREFIDEKVHDKFDNLESEQINIYFEVQYEGRTLKGNDRFAFYGEPMSHSKLGQFLNKYNDLAVGVKIKVQYNSKGFGSIIIE